MQFCELLSVEQASSDSEKRPLLLAAAADEALMVFDTALVVVSSKS